MASPEIVDISSLLEPISEESPVGSDLREDASPTSPYYTIKDARNSARAAERTSMFDGGSSEADENWRKILDLAPVILKDQAKDLEVSCWYTEALIRRHGHQGLRDGFSLLRQLIEKYWDDIYPLPDEDGVETRVAPITGLNGEGGEGVLIAPIRNVKITEGASVGPFNFWQYQQALEVQKISDEQQRSEKAEKNGFTIDDIEKAVAESSDSFYVDLVDDIQKATKEYREISRMLDEHCGTHEAPPTSNIINVLQETLAAVKYIGKLKLPSEETVAEGEATETGQAVAGASAVAVGAIRNRDDAFKQLSNIAEFFRKTEPHSPISYVLDKAVKWGDMTLSELMRELIPDTSSRQYYGNLTGIKTEDEF